MEENWESPSLSFKILDKLGSNRLFIKEPQRIYDGMPVAEIRKLMSSNGFYDKSGIEKRGAFSGVYKNV